MTATRKFGLVLMAGAAALAGPEAANEIAGTPMFSVIAPAEARVGRPLTPVSVAGVARRTGRRCRAGVYNC